MLPIFKRLKETGVSGTIVKHREPDEQPEDNKEESSSINECSKEILRAIHANDHQALSDALKEAFQIMDSEPHEEGPHIEPHSYQAQNRKAGE